MRSVRPRLTFRTLGGIASAALVLTSVSLVTAGPAAAASEPDCSAINDPVYEVLKPATGVSLVSAWQREIAGAAKYGFTDDQGVLFKASTEPAHGLTAVHRLYRAQATSDYLYTSNPGEVASAMARYGYLDQGPSFYVSNGPADCLVPIDRYTKDGLHRLLASTADSSALVADGWRREGVAFYAGSSDATATPPPAPAPPPAGPGAGTAFSFAVMPDTQQEVLRSSDPRMVNRAQWLVQQKPAFVAQTGDLVNWDTEDHSQYVIAKQAMNLLHDAGIPYTIAIGNHDTEATGVGGSARDPRHTYQLQRDTTTINSYFNTNDYTDVAGAYEKGKIDNVYALYEAGGLKWLLLDLEFCARPGAVAWAKQVVADHPDYNVIVSTHSYLDGSGHLDPSNQGYGDTSGQQLYDELVSQYPNVKMVFSGHVGYAERARVDTGTHGNKIYSFLTTMHENTTNPVRMVEVDPKAGTLKTYVYAPNVDKTWDAYTQTISGVDFVR